ncbi:uncharacterized protein KY384_005499 [Bacidia gigantensis]|uniref:uncharacterized protein n=1 Tax=Bacidia gigantensis TaxID=2732470 RepID=UPI001D03EE87|nr:uncharacterized protein KY384_005499 [Bacidia gigantensis]KAG8530017.1 hypothetical protein KY384_005499 [Bacidia gigantensis]
MIIRPKLSHFLVSIYLCATLTSAWPWPPSLSFPDLDSILVRRQDDGSKDSSSSASGAKPTDSPSKSAAASTGKSQSSSAKGSATSKGSAAATTTGSQQSDDTVDPRLPPGGVNMVTPSALATSTYYKIGVDSVSMVWNYTSLSVTPSKIDVLVSCSANQATYTLASNQSFEKTGSVVWDTQPEVTGTAPLLTETYTLIIHDAAKALTDRPEAGHLGAYNQYTFGMYVPQKYTPRTGKSHDIDILTFFARLTGADRMEVCYLQ